MEGYERDLKDGKCYPECPPSCNANEKCWHGECSCKDGYAKDQDDVCQEIPCGCHELADCVDDPATPVIVEKNCVCKAGFRGDGRTECVDIDECAEQTTEDELCGQAACCNLFGGFLCVCECGFEFDFERNKTCVDIDECALGTHACEPEQLCHNQLGYHSCSCDPQQCGVFMANKKFDQFLPCFKPEPYSP